MGHYDSDYEDEDRKRNEQAAVARHEAKKLLRQALELSGHIDAYSRSNYETKIREAIFWIDGPQDN